MYCICENPILAREMKVIPLGGDTSESIQQCPYCKRVTRLQLTVLRETPMTTEELNEMIKMQRSR